MITGCFIGMGNLLLIDLKAAERAKKEKELGKIMKTVMEDGRPIAERLKRPKDKRRKEKDGKVMEGLVLYHI